MYEYIYDLLSSNIFFFCWNFNVCICMFSLTLEDTVVINNNVFIVFYMYLF